MTTLRLALLVQLDISTVKNCIIIDGRIMAKNHASWKSDPLNIFKYRVWPSIRKVCARMCYLSHYIVVDGRLPGWTQNYGARVLGGTLGAGSRVPSTSLLLHCWRTERCEWTL